LFTHFMEGPSALRRRLAALEDEKSTIRHQVTIGYQLGSQLKPAAGTTK
jgi:hypothetical protein